MSDDISRRQPIGPCSIEWGGVRLGSPKSQVNIKYTRNTVEYGLEGRGTKSGSHATDEVCEIDIVVADFKPAQFRYALAQANSNASSTTISTAGYSGTVNYIHKFNETVKFSGTVTHTLAKAKFVTSTVKIFKTDFSNAPTGYVKGTDWTGTSSNGHIKRIGAGGIGTQETVFVEYNATATSGVAYAGGKMESFEGALRITYEDDWGKMLTIYAHRAKRKGASDFAIQMATAFGGIPMTFTILADSTKAPGRQLLEYAAQV